MVTKRFLIGVLSSLIFLCIIDVKALTITEETIDNYYAQDSTGNTYDLKFYQTEGEFLYSINFIDLITDKKFKTKYTSQSDFLNISEDKYQLLQNIIYFGYGYLNHNDIKWYVLTQYMIYKEMNVDVKIIDVNGIDVFEKYNEDYKELKKLISDFYLLPSYFSESIEFDYDSNYLLEDKNNVADLYTLVATTPGEVKLVDGKTYLTSKTPGLMELRAVKNLGYQESNNLYFSTELTLMNRAGLGVYVASVPVKVHGIGAKFKVTDEFGNALSNIFFNLYNSEDKLLYTFYTSKKGLTPITYLSLGEYYLVQTNQKEGYEIPKEKIKISLNDFEIKEINIVNEKIKGKVKINTSYKCLDNEELLPEVNSRFSIYKKNELVFSGNTDELGNLEFMLPIGVYTLKQDSSLMNFDLISDREITVDNEKDVIINIKNILECNDKSSNESIEKDETVQPDNIDESTDQITGEEGNEHIKDVELEDELEGVKEEEKITIEVPSTGLNIRPIYFVIAAIFLILSVICYVKK